MKDAHNEQDLKTIELMVQLVKQLERDRANERKTDTEPVLNYVSSYVTEKRQETLKPVRCDGFADLQLPPVMATMIEPGDRRRITVTIGGKELNFCSLWCMVGYCVRTEGMRLVPTEQIGAYHTSNDLRN